MRSNRPIGIFDSGVGGLTVARAVKEVLPDEQILYFGDTAHLPYGDKSTAAIQAYSVRISEMLIRKKCKVILIACNSASSAAYDLVTEYVGKRAQVFDVINPTVDFIREHLSSTEIGLIGTKQTVSSKVYDKKVISLGQKISLATLSTPLLVPMIEEGFSNNWISKGIIRTYLDHDNLSGIKALILGCTHYPIIKQEIEKIFSEDSRDVSIIDATQTVANALKAFLVFNHLTAKSRCGEDEFMVSDFTESFEKITKTFFGQKVTLQKVSIWEEME